MKLNPNDRYWLGWIIFGLVSLVAEYWVIYWSVTHALQSIVVSR